MKTGLPDDATVSPRPLNEGFRNQFTVFLMFVLLASIIWLFIKLSKDFASTVNFRIEYENVPLGQILTSAGDSILTVGLDARGFDLINYHVRKRKPFVSVDLSGVKLQQEGNIFTGYILTSALTRRLAQQIGSHNELIFISPDTLRFEFMPKHSRKVPVVPVVRYQLRPLHMLYDSVQTQPDSVWVYGPGDLVDTIINVKTAVSNFPDLHNDQNLSVSLLKPANLPLTYSTDVVELNLRVEKFTEKAFELPIRVVCYDEDLSLRIFPEIVKVHCLVALKDYPRIDPSTFDAVVVYRTGEVPTSNKIKIEISEHPSYVRIARLEPERVEYILVKQAR